MPSSMHARNLLSLPCPVGTKPTFPWRQSSRTACYKILPLLASSDSPVAFDFLEEVFYPMTTPVELCEEWYSRSPVRATRNAGSNSLGGRCLSEGRSYHDKLGETFLGFVCLAILLTLRLT